MDKKAYAAIRAEYSRQWMEECSVSCWVAIQRILTNFRAGKLTARQVQYWANRAAV